MFDETVNSTISNGLDQLLAKLNEINTKIDNLEAGQTEISESIETVQTTCDTILARLPPEQRLMSAGVKRPRYASERVVHGWSKSTPLAKSTGQALPSSAEPAENVYLELGFDLVDVTDLQATLPDE